MSSWPTAIVQEDIDRYAELSGDNNPIHVDAEFARTTPYGSTIAHGPMTAALITRYVVQDLGFQHRLKRLSLKFVNPVRSGDQLQCGAQRAEADSTALLYDVWCCNQRGETISAGTAEIAPEPVR